MIDRAKLFDAVDDVRQLIDANAPSAEIIMHLIRKHGGAYRDANGTYELRVAGLRRSSTVGPVCLVREWLGKARAELGSVR